MQRVNFQNSEGLDLVGALHEPTGSTKSAVVIAHGFASNKDRARHKQLAEALANEEIAAFRIDFGGSGESDDREITIAAQVDDLQSAINYLKSQGYEHIGVLGESLGGITALLAHNSDVQAMVLWAPVTKARWTTKMGDEQKKSLEEKGYFIKVKDNKQFKIPQAYIDERENLDREGVLSKVTIPVMIVHGTADKTIPIKDSEEAMELLPKGSVLERIENWEHGDHRMDEDMHIIIPKTVDWFKQHLGE